MGAEDDLCPKNPANFGCHNISFGEVLKRQLSRAELPGELTEMGSLPKVYQTKSGAVAGVDVDEAKRPMRHTIKNTKVAYICLLETCQNSVTIRRVFYKKPIKQAFRSFKSVLIT
jgi:hypothetical protein